MEAWDTTVQCVWQFAEHGGWKDMDDERSQQLEDYKNQHATNIVIEIPNADPPARHHYDLITMKQFREHMSDGCWEVVSTRNVRRIWLAT